MNKLRMLTREELLGYLIDKCDVDLSNVIDSTPLFTSGLVDSFLMVDLVVFLEATAGLRIAAEDIKEENLDSIQNILRFVEFRARAGEQSSE